MTVNNWLILGAVVLAVSIVIALIPPARRFVTRVATASMMWVDRRLVWLSTPFYTQSTHDRSRWAVFIAWYVAISAIAWFCPNPWVQLAAIVWGLFSVLTINRAWEANEKRRSKIAKKIDPDATSKSVAAAAGEPDTTPTQSDTTHPPDCLGSATKEDVPVTPEPEAPSSEHAEPVAGKSIDGGERFALYKDADGEYMPYRAHGRQTRTETTTRMQLLLRALPDLRLMALVAGMQLAFLVPLLFLSAHDAVGVFDTDEHVSFRTAGWLVLDRGILIRAPGIFGPDWRSPLHLLPRASVLGLFIYPLFYYLVILAIIRWLQIREDINEGILGVRHDPDMPVLVGRRAVNRLLDHLNEPDLHEREITHTLIALGKLRDYRARETLQQYATHSQDRLRSAAALALGHLGTPLALRDTPPRPLTPEIKSENEEVCKTLKQLLLTDRHQLVRASAAIALRSVDHPDAATILINRLDDIQKSKPTSRTQQESDPDVIKHILESIGIRLGNNWRVTTPDEATRAVQIRQAIQLILKKGQSLLWHRYLRVRNRAVTALGQLVRVNMLPSDERTQALDAMLEILEEGRNENPKLVAAGATAVGTLAPALEAADAEHAADGLCDLLLRENTSIQVAAARALGELAIRIPTATGPSSSREDIITSLLDALVIALKEDDTALSDELYMVLADKFGTKSQADEAYDKWDWQRNWGRVDTVADPAQPISMRVEEAEKIAGVNDHVTRDRLRELLDKGELDPTLRSAIDTALARVQEAIDSARDRAVGDDEE